MSAWPPPPSDNRPERRIREEGVPSSTVAGVAVLGVLILLLVIGVVALLVVVL